MTAIELFRDVPARLVAAEEALQDGDTGLAFAILVDLEADVVASLAALSMEAS